MDNQQYQKWLHDPERIKRRDKQERNLGRIVFIADLTLFSAIILVVGITAFLILRCF